MRQPAFWSLALSEISDPDYTYVAVDVLPAHATADPAAWARNLLSVSALPRWIAAPISAGDLLVRRTPSCGALRVRHVQGDEALIRIDGSRFDARIAIGVDEDAALVRVVTALRYKGAAARMLTLPLRALMPLVLHGMIARTRRELSGATRR